jgi:hypothetical protein
MSERSGINDRMSDGSANQSTPTDDSLDGLAAAAQALEPPMPHERKWVLRSEAGILLDGLLTRCARGHGALDVAIGDGLAALATGERVIRLGFSGIGDYARERLGLAAGTAQKMARLARELKERPALREAVWTGEVTARKAEVVLPLARGDDEATWVLRARSETVRGLLAAVKAAATGRVEPAEDEPWDRICVPVPDDVRPVLDEALALSGRALGATTPKWQRLEAICQEFLGSHGAEGESPEAAILAAPVEHWLEPVKEWLEQQSQEWSFLEGPAPVAATADLVHEDPSVLDAELQRLAKLRDRWNEVFGHLAMLFRMLGLWRDAQFASFGHYCAERLGMAERTVEQRIWLERSLHALPALRTAMREGRLSHEKARLVASHATDRNLGELIATAEAMTCIALRRKLDADEERQMCTRRELDLRVPRSVGLLLRAAMDAARKAAGRWLPPGECLRVIAQHFVDTWGRALKQRQTPRNEVIARDKGCCKTPYCSKAANHAHHIEFRSHGGSDDPSNQVAICSVHHLRGVHMGRIRVWGRAPDDLHWELGERQR